MKKIILLFTLVLFVKGSFASSVINPEFPKPKASEIFIPVGNSGKMISLMELSTISTKDFQSLTGKQMNFFQRLSFKLGQRKLKKLIDADGILNNRTLDKIRSIQSNKPDDSGNSFIKGFLMGLVLGLFGVMICAAAGHGENKQSMMKGAWIGCGIWVLIVLLIVILKSALV